MTKMCKTCGSEKPFSEFLVDRRRQNNLGSRCRECDRKRQAEIRKRPERKRATKLAGRKYRAENPEKERQRALRNMTPAKVAKHRAMRDPVKDAARRKLRNAVASGKVVKPTMCQDCAMQKPPLHGHHTDYTKPLEVEWLCSPCHGKRHEKD